MNLLLFSLTNELIRSWNIESYHPCVNKVETKTKQEMGDKRMGRYIAFQDVQGVSDNDIFVLTPLKEECMLQIIHHWKWIPNSLSDIKKGQEKLTYFSPMFH